MRFLFLLIRLYIETFQNIKRGRVMLNKDFSEKINLYKDTVFRTAYTYCKNRADAEDITQETFIKLYTSKNTFKSENEERAWLIRVTINSCKDLFKSYRFRKCTELDEKIAVYNYENDCQEVLNAVMSLPEKYRIIIHLFYYEQLSIKEISEITGRKASTLQTQLQRAREKLKKILKEEYDYE